MKDLNSLQVLMSTVYKHITNQILMVEELAVFSTNYPTVKNSNSHIIKFQDDNDLNLTWAEEVFKTSMCGRELHLTRSGKLVLPRLRTVYISTSD
jgi:hypothetical protein